MMAQSRGESTWEINNYGKYINQSLANTIKSIRQYERTNKKIFDRGCRIHRLHLCRGVTPSPITTNECPVYDTKQSDGEIPVLLELWGCGVPTH